MAIPGSFFQLQISRILSDVFEVLLSATVAGNSCSHLRDGDFIADSNVDWPRSSFQSHGSSMILTMPIMVLKYWNADTFGNLFKSQVFGRRWANRAMPGI